MHAALAKHSSSGHDHLVRSDGEMLRLCTLTAVSIPCLYHYRDIAHGNKYSTYDIIRGQCCIFVCTRSPTYPPPPARMPNARACRCHSRVTAVSDNSPRVGSWRKSYHGYQPPIPFAPLDEARRIIHARPFRASSRCWMEVRKGDSRSLASSQSRSPQPDQTDESETTCETPSAPSRLDSRDRRSAMLPRSHASLSGASTAGSS